MNGAKSVLAVGGLAPESLARLREDGLRVDVRAAGGDAELAAGVDGSEALIVAPGVRVTAARARRRARARGGRLRGR